jgi:transposase, IS30 family
MEPKKYVRISMNERIEIEKMIAQKKTYSEIAIHLGRNKSSIQREVVKFGRSRYKALTALWHSVSHASNKRYGKTKMNQHPDLKAYVNEKLQLRWSPQQISISLKHKFPDNPLMQISHETIYFYVYVHSKTEVKNMLISQLRQKRKYRGNVRRGKDKRTTIVDPIRIDERPEEVKGRLIPGHWEGDLIMGKDRESAIGTLVERTTRTILIVPLKKRDSKSVRTAFEREFKLIPQQMKKTLTYDNGSEMAQHKLFTKHTKIQVYFAHPYSPWERPTNENSNGLVRDYFPKGTDFKTITKARLKEVQNQLNERPRKVLNWKTPKDVFDKMILEKI